MEPLETNNFDYIGVIKSRKKYIIIPFLCIFLIFTIVAFILPSEYRTSCTILIEGQQIPSDIIRTTVSSYAEQTIKMLTQQITSRSKLTEIINRLNLYVDLRKRKTTEEIIEKMRQSINIKMISAEVADQRTGRQSIVTIAFELFFEGKDPDKVQKVVNLLASLYLEENLKIRERKAETTSSFLEAELENLKENISQLEMNIAQFKAKYLNSLPEMTQINFQIIERIERELDSLERRIDSLKERKIYLQSQLSMIDPYLPGIKTKTGRSIELQQRLTLLYSRYISMKASYSEDHPDLIRLEKELKSLEEELGFQENLRMKEQKLKELNASLQEKEAIFSDQHLDIIRLKKAIEYLKEDIADMHERTTIGKIAEDKPDNPAYININTQIATIEMELEGFELNKKTLRDKLSHYQNRLELAPQIELEYKILTRDYENALARYRETMYKLMQAKAAEALEKEQIAERFTIIDPGIYPEEPYKPNRLAIILIGFILSLGIGIGYASIKEYTDHTIRSEVALMRITNKPVLTTVSVIENKADKRKRRIRYLIVTLILLSTVALCALMIHLFVMRLDILWIKILRSIEQIKYYLPKKL